MDPRRVCAVLSDGDLASELQRLRGVGRVELRLDLRGPRGLSEPPALLVGRHPGLLATLRPVRERGAFSGPEPLRLDLLRRWGRTGARLDLEWDATPREPLPGVEVLSRHLRGPASPEELPGLLRDLERRAPPGALVKLAVPCDPRGALELLRHQTPRRLLVPIGPEVSGFRREAVRLGAPWCYAGAREPVAPGQPTVLELCRPLVLVGLRGSGKSTIGRRLALALGRPFVDLDDRLDPGLLPRDPEAFRALEHAELLEVLDLPATVVAAGGGVVEHRASREALRRGAHVLWLRASPETLGARVLRDPRERPALVPGGPVHEARELAVRRDPWFSELHPEEVCAEGEPEVVLTLALAAARRLEA